MRYSHGLEYRVSKSGVAVLCGVGNCFDEHIVIPSSVEGYTVVGVSEKAFARCLQVKSVTLPSSICFVGDNAFAWCRNLKEVNARGLSEIGSRAFMGCDALTDVSFGDQIEKIGEKAFAYCPSLISVTLPDSLTRLGAAAFEGCRNLAEISLSDNLAIIENSTFYACDNLYKISLPSGLEFIDEYAFAYCSSIGEMNLPTKTVINRDAFFESNLIKKAS
jgi:hypothetical protein